MGVETAVAIIGKAVVGFAVGKIVGEITGNEVLGALAGGIAGGGLSFQTGQGFTWSLAGNSTAAAASTQAGGELLATMPGGANLLEGVALDAGGLFAEGAANVDLLGGGADILKNTVTSNAGGALGGASDLAGAIGQGAVDVATQSGGSFFDMLSKGDMGFGNDLLRGDQYAINTPTRAGIQAPAGGSTLNPRMPDPRMTQAARTAAPGAQQAGAQAAAQGGEQGFLDKAIGYLDKHPTLSNIAAKGVEAMMAPERETYEDAARAEYNQLRKFQTDGFDGVNTPPRTPSLQDHRGVFNRTSSLDELQPRYSAQRSRNYQAILDEIRNRRTRTAEEAA